MNRLRSILLAIGVSCVLTAPASAEHRDIVVPPPTVALGIIADPDDYAVVAASGAPQYDSRTFVPEAGGPPHSFSEAMAAQDLHLGRELQLALAEALLETGAKVVPPESKSADVRLIVAIVPHTAGYSDAVLGDDLMPGFAVRMIVTGARSNRILFTRRILYGEAAERNARTLYPDARYRFSSVSALMADPKSAADGFRAGALMIAKEIARLMRR